jgi:flagellar basal-body rod modification protein FlgD
MTTNAINSATNSAVSAALGAATGKTATSALSGLDQNSFMTLMLTQLKNQDPLNPQDPSAFLSQLAQMSTVTGIQSMKTSITSLSDSLRSTQVIDGTAMVGHSVMSVAASADLGAAGSVNGAVTIPQGTSQAAIAITDASGALVRTLPLATQAGTTTFAWDGTTSSGSRAPAGTYSYSAVATVGGVPQQLETQIASKVNSVTIDPTTNSLTLNTDIGSIPLASVRSVM